MNNAHLTGLEEAEKEFQAVTKAAKTAKHIVGDLTKYIKKFAEWLRDDESCPEDIDGKDVSSDKEEFSKESLKEKINETKKELQDLADKTGEKIDVSEPESNIKFESEPKRNPETGEFKNEVKTVDKETGKELSSKEAVEKAQKELKIKEKHLKQEKALEKNKSPKDKAQLNKNQRPKGKDFTKDITDSLDKGFIKLEKAPSVGNEIGKTVQSEVNNVGKAAVEKGAQAIQKATTETVKKTGEVIAESAAKVGEATISAAAGVATAGVGTVAFKAGKKAGEKVRSVINGDLDSILTKAIDKANEMAGIQGNNKSLSKTKSAPSKDDGPVRTKF